MMKLKLSKPLQYRDKTEQEIELDLEGLTGNDLIEVEEELKKRGISVNAWEYSRTYLIALAAKSMHIPQEALMSLGAKDFTSIVNEVLGFLAGTASQDSQEGSSGV